MPDDRLARVTEMFLRKGNIADDVGGDVRAAALAWLDRARQELSVLDPILAASQWRIAYNTAYDIYRHSAEAVDLDAGCRVLASPGAHTATFAVADALLRARTGVFASVNASTMSSTRNKLEYVDVDHTQEVTEEDARWAAQLAERAVAEVAALLS